MDFHRISGPLVFYAKIFLWEYFVTRESFIMERLGMPHEALTINLGVSPGCDL